MLGCSVVRRLHVSKSQQRVCNGEFAMPFAGSFLEKRPQFFWVHSCPPRKAESTAAILKALREAGKPCSSEHLLMAVLAETGMSETARHDAYGGSAPVFDTCIGSGKLLLSGRGVLWGLSAI